jgi:nitrite reductase/ring-hydroxylating ferredoxin subunit
MSSIPSVDFLERDIDGVTYCQVAQSRQITTRRGFVVAFDDETQIAIFRTRNLQPNATQETTTTLYAVSNICPHQHAPVLYDGVVQYTEHNGARDCTITCPLHGWTYSLTTGLVEEGGSSNLKHFRVFERDGFVWLEKPEPFKPQW